MIGRLETSDRTWQLRFERLLRQEPARVWKALTEPDELATWFPDRIVVEEWRVGAKLEFQDANADIQPFDGEVLAVEPNAFLEFRWGTDTIRFEIEKHGSGTRLILVDTIDELGKAARDGAGWHLCLDALEHALAGTVAPPISQSWSTVHSRYVQSFGPEASTIAPPDAANPRSAS